MGLISGLLSDPALCCSAPLCLRPGPLCARRLSLPPALLFESLPSLLLRPLSPFILPRYALQPPPFIFPSLPVGMPFRKLLSASSQSLFEQPLCRRGRRCCIPGRGTLPSPTSTHATLQPNPWEITALPRASVSLSGFHLSLLLRPEAAVCDKPDRAMTAWSQLGMLP